jgi:transposase-like protein
MKTRRFFDMTRRKGSKDYPVWMKREALRLYLEEGWSVSEILRRYAITDRNRINAWARQYQVEGEGMFANKRSRSGRKPKKDNTATYIAQLEMELDLLKKFHTELRQGSLAKRDIGLSNTTGEDTK